MLDLPPGKNIAIETKTVQLQRKKFQLQWKQTLGSLLVLFQLQRKQTLDFVLSTVSIATEINHTLDFSFSTISI